MANPNANNKAGRIISSATQSNPVRVGTLAETSSAAPSVATSSDGHPYRASFTDMPLDTFMENDLSSEDMRVVGSLIAPIHFYAGPSDATEMWYVEEIELGFAAPGMKFDDFGENALLTEGILMGAGDSNNTIHFDALAGHGPIKTNGDFVKHTGTLGKTSFAGPAAAIDTLMMRINFVERYSRPSRFIFGTPLARFIVSIRDDLTAQGLTLMSAKMYGWIVAQS